MLPKLCHLDNDLEIMIINIQYIYCVVHDLHTLPGDIFFSRYPSVALARNSNYISVHQVSQVSKFKYIVHQGSKASVFCEEKGEACCNVAVCVYGRAC